MKDRKNDRGPGRAESRRYLSSSICCSGCWALIRRPGLPTDLGFAKPLPYYLNRNNDTNECEARIGIWTDTEHTLKLSYHR
jgi:hypothetical protein